MKVRVLYPTAFVGILKEDPAAGDVVDVDATMADALMAQGYAEAHRAKGDVEQATAAPGEKRGPGRPRKNTT